MKIDSIIKQKIEFLKENNIEKIGYTKLSCIGYFPSSTAYLFWIDEKRTYIQKFEDGNSRNEPIKKFKTLIIRDSVFFDFYAKHKENILKEEVKPFNYKLDSIVGNIYYSTKTTTSHSCFTNITMQIGKTFFHKYFDHYDIQEFDKEKVQASKRTKEDMKKWKDRGWELETDSIFENHPIKNIHFASNNNLKIVEWDLLLTEFIDKMESENKFDELKTE